MIKYVKWWLLHLHTNTYVDTHYTYSILFADQSAVRACECVLLLAIFFCWISWQRIVFYDHFCYCLIPILMLLLLLVLWRWRRLLLLLQLSISLSFNSSIQLSHSVKVNFGIFDWPSKILLRRTCESVCVWVNHVSMNSFLCASCFSVCYFFSSSSSPLLPLPSPASSSSSAAAYYFFCFFPFSYECDACAVAAVALSLLWFDFVFLTLRALYRCSNIKLSQN